MTETSHQYALRQNSCKIRKFRNPRPGESADFAGPVPGDRGTRVARERDLDLSLVIGEALERGLRGQEDLRRSGAVLDSYNKASPR